MFWCTEKKCAVLLKIAMQESEFIQYTWANGFQIVVPESAALAEKVLEMQILGFYPRSAESETVSVDGTRQSVF